MAHVLIVEDEKSIRTTLGVFMENEGYRVDLAADAERGLEILEEMDIDVVVSEIIMPRMSGVALLKEIRAIAPHVQVILMTGEPTAETATEALRAGAIDYLAKPIRKAAILKTVAHAARIKEVDDERRRLVAENHEYQIRLSGLVEERTRALHASHAKYNTLARVSPVGIFQSDSAGSWMSVNQCVCEMMGCKEKGILGKGWLGSVHLEDRDRVQAQWVESIQENEPFASEFRVCGGGGEPVWVFGQTIAEKDAIGYVVGYIGTITDITQSKLAEMALARNEAALAMAQEIAHLGSWEQNFATDVLWWSDEVYRIFGIEPQQFGATVEVFLGYVHPEDRDRVGKAFGDSVENKALYNIIHRVLRPDGVVRVVHERCEHFLDDEGNVVRSVGTVLDITDRVRAEEAAAESQRKLLEHERDQTELAKAEVEKLRRKLVNQARLATVGQMAASIAHELRNPLGAVRNAAFYLKRHIDTSNPKLPEYLDIIDQEVAAADRVIRDMMEMARSKEPVKESVDLGAVIRATMDRVLAGCEIEGKVMLDHEPFLVRADSGQLRQVLSNILTNARQMLPLDGVVTIEARTEGDHDLITIRDNGPGVSAKDREFIFEPLYTTKAKGTGLGLTVCRQIIEYHGGEINLLEPSGAGAAFRIRLPH